MDWTATILAAAGTHRDSVPLDGENLLPVCAGTLLAYDRTFCWRTTTESAARMGRWSPFRESSGEQLFDLLSDPGEKVNLRNDAWRGVREDKEPIRGVEHSNAATALVISSRSFLFRSRRTEDIRQPVVAFVTRVLEGWLRLVVGQIHRKRPRPRPRPRIVECDAPLDLVVGNRREAFDDADAGVAPRSGEP